MARKSLHRTTQELDAEIARLQKERDQIREDEKAGVVGRMKEAIAYYGITAADLGLDAAKRKARTGVAKAKDSKTQRAAGRIKYKDDAGHTWSGYGPSPSGSPRHWPAARPKPICAQRDASCRRLSLWPVGGLPAACALPWRCLAYVGSSGSLPGMTCSL
nr:H-NS histone family protein [Diaphorobacter aerolatus]